MRSARISARRSSTSSVPTTGTRVCSGGTPTASKPKRCGAGPAAEAASARSDAETRDELWVALLKLPVQQREAIVCRFYLDMSEQQTAEALGVRVGTVKSTTSRGLQALRAALEPEVAP